MVRPPLNSRFGLLLGISVVSLIVLFLYQRRSFSFVASPHYGAGGSDTTTEQHKNHHNLKKLGAIIAAGRADTDLAYMNRFENKWELYLYNVDDPDPPPRLWIPKNKGHEAMVYLSFIIANYDSLPDRAIFLHGHRQSWHQEADIDTLITNLRIETLDNSSYVPMRCDWYPSCPAEIRPIDHDAIVWGPGVHRDDAERGIEKAWVDLFGPDVEIPRTIASPCCAQFAVTRQAIQSRSKATYEGMRDWLLKTDLVDDVSGRVMEKLWAYIMTDEPVRCPPPQICACENFGQCESKTWPEPPAGLPHWPTT